MSAPLSTRLEPLARFAANREEWAALERASLDRNPFYAPDFLLACADHLERTRAITVLSVWKDERLVGFLPLHPPSWREGLPFGAISAWSNPYVCLTTPLLAADLAREVFAAMLARLDGEKGLGEALSLTMLPAQRRTGVLIERFLQEESRANVTISHYARAILDPLPGTPFREYVEQESLNSRKDFRRREARLMAFGPIEHAVFSEPGPRRAAALDQFLRLEAAGWKGRHRTALMSRPETFGFIRQAFRQNTGFDYEVECLSANGIALAMSLNLISGDIVHTFKQAYDETWRPYAPGKLLDRRAIHRATTTPLNLSFDSCALPGYPIEEIWHERMVISHRLIGIGAAAKGRRVYETARRAMAIQKWLRRLKRWRKALRGSTAPKAPVSKVAD